MPQNDDASHGTLVDGGKVMPEEMKQGGFALFSEKMMELVIGNVNVRAKIYSCSLFALALIL